ncbi:DUF7218 family protein [Marivirga sp.]|nr:hypothetical protein [Marivirga sp.]HET8860033.1 hypothetical protein [Marivirga sp.]
MAKKNNIPQVKNEEQYEALRDKGMSKEKSPDFRILTPKIK